MGSQFTDTFKEKAMSEVSPVQSGAVQPPAQPVELNATVLLQQIAMQLAASQQFNAALGAQVQSLTKEVANLRAMTGAPQPASSMRRELRNDVLYVRLKPTTAPGCSRRRMWCNELDCVIQGGSGLVGDIPVWYTADPSLREKLEGYLQNDEDQRSEYALDVCTADERAMIDQAEETMRRSNAGFKPRGDVQTKSVRAHTVDKDAAATLNRARRAKPRPSIAAGAASYLQEGEAQELARTRRPAAPAQTAARQRAVEVQEPEAESEFESEMPMRVDDAEPEAPQVALSAPLAGRAAALAGLPASQPPQAEAAKPAAPAPSRREKIRAAAKARVNKAAQAVDLNNEIDDAAEELAGLVQPGQGVTVGPVNDTPVDDGTPDD